MDSKSRDILGLRKLTGRALEWPKSPGNRQSRIRSIQATLRTLLHREEPLCLSLTSIRVFLKDSDADSYQNFVIKQLSLNQKNEYISGSFVSLSGVFRND